MEFNYNVPIFYLGSRSLPRSRFGAPKFTALRVGDVYYKRSFSPLLLCLIAAAFVFVQCLQQARAAAATKAADAAADAPMAFSMSTGRSPRCHLAFEPWGEIKAYQIVIKLHKTETMRLGNDLRFNSAAISSLLSARMCRFVAEKDVSSLLGFH